MLIVRPITPDGAVGYDEFDQLVWTRQEHGRKVSSFVADVRAKTCLICNRGWESTGPSIGDQMRWNLVDAHVHETCLVRHSGLVERSEFYSALVGARVRFRGLRAIENRYWPKGDPWAQKPWYEAELIDHAVRFTLGWRKNVAHVELVAEGGTEFDWWERAQEAFKSEDVTKSFGAGGVLLHAWSREKVREYVKGIVALLPVVPERRVRA